MKNFNTYTLQDQLDLAKSFEKVILRPGERIYQPKNDKLDSFNIILKGKVGIFYPEISKLKKLLEDPTRVVALT